MNPTISLTRRFFVLGRAFELWENPDHPFGWHSDDLRQYAADESWEALFNALVIRASQADLTLE